MINKSNNQGLQGSQTKILNVDLDEFKLDQEIRNQKEPLKARLNKEYAYPQLLYEKITPSVQYDLTMPKPLTKNQIQGQLSSRLAQKTPRKFKQATLN